MTRSNKIFLGIFGLCAIGLVVVYLIGVLEKVHSKHYAESHAIARTRADIHNISLTIRIYVNDFGYLPEPLKPGQTKIDPKYLAEQLYLFLKNSSAMHIIQEPLPKHWEESKMIVDHFGNPLNFCIAPALEPRKYIVKIWSNGLNGKNEEGQGDDICNIFEVELSNVNYEKTTNINKLLK